MVLEFMCMLVGCIWLWIVGKNVPILLFVGFKFDFGKAKDNPTPFSFSDFPVDDDHPLLYVEPIRV